jgi:uncharacterized protein
MALTNYLAQSVLFSLVFYRYGYRYGGLGLGLFGRLGSAETALLGVGVYIAQVAWSAWWLGRYRFGPLEWAWRSLTYGARQPMRTEAAGRSGGRLRP